MLLHHPGDYVELVLDGGAAKGGVGVVIDRVWIKEDITTGQRVQEFQVLTQTVHGAEFTKLANGTSIGHKRIVVFEGEEEGKTGIIRPVAVRVAVTKAYAWPVELHELAAFSPCKRPE